MQGFQALMTLSFLMMPGRSLQRMAVGKKWVILLSYFHVVVSLRVIAVCFSNPHKALAELGCKARLGLQRMTADAWRWQKRNPDGYWS